MFIPGVLGVTSVSFTLSQTLQVAASQATISFVTSESIPSGGSITMRFPFGNYGNGTMSFLGIMDGEAIGNNGIPLHAVNLLADGVTLLNIVEDSP